MHLFSLNVLRRSDIYSCFCFCVSDNSGGFAINFNLNFFIYVDILPATFIYYFHFWWVCGKVEFF